MCSSVGRVGSIACPAKTEAAVPVGATLPWNCALKNKLFLRMVDLACVASKGICKATDDDDDNDEDRVQG